MKRSVFYFIITLMVLLNGYLLSRPNLLGKIGLIIYKYYYLRSFPRTLLTVSIITIVCIVITELIYLLVRMRVIKSTIGSIVLITFITLTFVQLAKTGIDFSAWGYSHSGLRFRLGAFMLPTLLIGIFTYALLKLPKPPNIPIASTQNDLESSERIKTRV